MLGLQASVIKGSSGVYPGLTERPMRHRLQSLAACLLRRLAWHAQAWSSELLALVLTLLLQSTQLPPQHVLPAAVRQAVMIQDVPLMPHGCEQRDPMSVHVPGRKYLQM